MLKGSVYVDDKPSEAKIELIKKETNEAIGPYYANSKSGKYLMAITPGSGYKIKITVKGMEPIEEEIDVEKLQKFVEIKKDFYVYTAEFENKKKESSVKTILDSLLNNVVSGDTFKNDAPINNSVDAKTNPKTIIKTEAPVNVKTETLAKIKAETTTNTKTKDSVKSTNLTPCGGSATPDFTSIKGKSLNDPAIYNQLLSIGGAICADGLIFKVQIAAYKYPENYKYDHLKKFGAPEIVNYPDGITRFTQLSFSTIKEAEVARQKIIANGQKDAWLTAFIDGKRFTLEELILVNFNSKAIN